MLYSGKKITAQGHFEITEHELATSSTTKQLIFRTDLNRQISKMNRIVEYFSRRPQIQERLTEQIYHALSFILDTENVALTIDAKHFCVKSRGVEDTECSTVTSRLGGSFKAHPEVRAEFLALLK